MSTLGADPTPRGETAAAGRPAGATAGYALASGAFGLLLLVAAGLKLDAVFSGDERAPGDGSPAQLLSALLEISVAVWLLAAVQRKWARRAAMAVLVVFVAVAGWRLVRGEADCGCFGHVRVHPAWTLAFDLLALSAIWYFGRWTSAPARPSDVTRRQIGARSLVALLAGVAVPALTMAVIAELRASDPGGFAAVGDAVLLVPRDWAGKPFPLLPELEPSEHDVSRGPWVVVLVNRGCHACDAYLASAEFESLRQSVRQQDPPRRFVVLEVGKDAAEGGGIVSPDLPQLRPRQGKTFLVDGPYEVLMTDGVVERARRVVAGAPRPS